MDKKQQIRFIKNMYKEVDQNEYLEIRELPSCTQSFIPIKDFKGWNQKSDNVYFGVFTRHTKSGKSKNCSVTPALWADFDDEMEGLSIEEKVEKARDNIYNANLPEPSTIVLSGRGIHCYWTLDKPAGDIAVEVNKAIAYATKADMRATDKARILRVPGTLNLKDLKNPLECKIIEEKNNRRYSIDLFKEILRDTLNKKMIMKESTRRKKIEEPSKVTNVSYEKVRFDFKKDISKVNICVETYQELIDSIKSYNMLTFTDLPLDYTEITFNCCLHEDQNPSANIFVSEDKFYLYKCFGCGQTLDLIGIYRKLSSIDKSFMRAVEELSKILGISRKFSPFIEGKMAKYQQNIKVLYEFEQLSLNQKYPNLNKLLKNRKRYLNYVYTYAQMKLGSERNRFEDEDLFFFSYDYFSRIFENANLSTTYRNINLFCALGLIDKIPLERIDSRISNRAKTEAEKTTKRINQVRPKKYRIKEANPINFYVAPNIMDRLEIAEERAKILLDNDFVIKSCVNKEFFIKILGPEVAESIYPDGRKVSKKNLEISDRLENTMIKEIKKKGYTTKKEIITKTRFRGKNKVSKTKKECELNKNFRELLDKYDLTYRKSNKELMERFEIKTPIYIITTSDNCH